MNRLQKKCFIVSVGFHALLVLVLFVGSAFLSPRDRFDSMPVLTFVPAVTTDERISGGGNRNARTPAPAPPAPQPVAVPPAPQASPQAEKPDPPKPAPKDLEPSRDSLDASSTSRKQRKIQVSTTLVSRRRDSTTTSADATAANAAAAANARRASTAISSALRDLRSGLSSGTEIGMPGPGTGGVPYANFLQAVQSVYTKAWQGRVPDGTTDKDTDVIASVTILRDGSVASGRITRSSGNAAVDRAVQEVLDYVKYAAPLPEGAAEDQRTVTIKFKVNTG